MIKLVVLRWLSIMTPSVSDSEGGCGGESITKSGPTKSWSKQEFAIFISILIYTYGIRVKYVDRGAKNEQTPKMRKSQKQYNHKNFIFLTLENLKFWKTFCQLKFSKSHLKFFKIWIHHFGDHHLANENFGCGKFGHQILVHQRQPPPAPRCRFGRFCGLYY